VRDDAAVDVAREEFVACPDGGREFTRPRPVRLGDVAATGRLRLDALARFLQDVAADDGDEFGLHGAGAWVLRRAALRFGALPRFRDVADLTTFCSGAGPRWAERRTTVRVADRVAAESAAVWVFVDRDGRPTNLEPWFHELYGASAGGRRVSGRLRLPAPTPRSVGEPWPLRTVDVDVLGHVNNAVAWAAVEDALARESVLDDRLRGATLEYRAPIDPGDVPELVTEAGADHLACWLRCSGEVRVAARVELFPAGAQ
jgi:acyl-ACP thioesterase